MNSIKERKFIIIQLDNKLHHYKATGQEDHFIILKNNGLHLTESSNYRILEKGIILDNHEIEVWECNDKSHISHLKRNNKWLGTTIDDYIKENKEWWQK